MPMIGWSGNAAPTVILRQVPQPKIHGPSQPERAVRYPSIGPRANCIAAMLARSVQPGKMAVHCAPGRGAATPPEINFAAADVRC
jgi:hypothetical protein